MKKITAWGLDFFKSSKEKATEALESAQSTGENLVKAAQKAREAFSDSLDNDHPVDEITTSDRNGEVK